MYKVQFNPQLLRLQGLAPKLTLSQYVLLVPQL